jgi:hypothetical protein
MADYGRASSNRPAVHGDLSKASIFDRTGVFSPDEPVATHIGDPDVVILTQEQYDALAEPDDNVLYAIIQE